MAATADRPRRADAVRNRERVIRAAAEVFAAKGLEAGVPEIAARAGVGKATVYRSFPSKEHLVAAVACERLDWICDVALAALHGDEEPGAALERVVVTIAERQASDCAIAGSLAASMSLPELDASRAAVQTALGALVERARASGAIRADATAEELRVLFTGIARVLRDADERDAAVWRRYGALAVAALRGPLIAADAS
jgi:AcrR family transcriptional regulator